MEPLTSGVLVQEIREEAGRLTHHPIEEVRRLEHVALDGESPATLLLTGLVVALAVALIYAVVTTIAMALYYAG